MIKQSLFETSTTIYSCYVSKKFLWDLLLSLLFRLCEKTAGAAHCLMSSAAGERSFTVEAPSLTAPPCGLCLHQQPLSLSVGGDGSLGKDYSIKVVPHAVLYAVTLNFPRLAFFISPPSQHRPFSILLVLLQKSPPSVCFLQTLPPHTSRLSLWGVWKGEGGSHKR